MAYYSGVASDMVAVRQALIDACTQPSEGWAWNAGSEVLSKGALFLRLQVVSGYLTLLGRTSGAGGDAPDVVRIGPFTSVPVTFPVSYHLFLFEDEVYLVIKYDLDRFQWCAFGKSSVQGLPGTGMWLGASLSARNHDRIWITPTTGGGGQPSATSAALFYTTGQTGAGNRNCWVHSNFEGRAWSLAHTDTGTQPGIRTLAPLFGLLPNAWNSEAVLLPLRGHMMRPSGMLSVSVDLQHARHTRIDNYLPEEIVSVGPDRWMILPWHRKNTAERNGGVDVLHTGTMGFAVRYEGP